MKICTGGRSIGGKNYVRVESANPVPVNIECEWETGRALQILLGKRFKL